MKENELRDAFFRITTCNEMDARIKQQVEEKMNGTNRRTGSELKRFVAVLAGLLVLFIAGNVTAFAFSEGYRSSLSEFLNIDREDTHYIGDTDSDSGICMSVESTHVVGNMAMVMAVFTKENGEDFKNSLSPDVRLSAGGKELSGFFVYSNLSEDKRILNCYISFQMNRDFTGSKVALSVEELVCNESQVTDLDFEEEFEEAYIKGNWECEFVLEPDRDNTLQFINQDKDRKVSMCGRSLEVKSAVVGDMAVIVNTATIGEIEPLPVDPFSNICVSSGAYYDVFVSIFYKDGSVDKLDCALDDDGNIIAYALDVINKPDIEKITVGNCTLEKDSLR